MRGTYFPFRKALFHATRNTCGTSAMPDTALFAPTITTCACLSWFSDAVRHELLARRVVEDVLRPGLGVDPGGGQLTQTILRRADWV